MRRSSSSTPSRRPTAPKVRWSRPGGIWRRTRRLPNGQAVPGLAVSAATEIVRLTFWKPRSAIYAAFWLRWILVAVVWPLRDGRTDDGPFGQQNPSEPAADARVSCGPRGQGRQADHRTPQRTRRTGPRWAEIAAAPRHHRTGAAAWG